MMRAWLCFVVLALCAACASSDTQLESAAEPPYHDLLHSDLPLFDDEFEDKWPRHITDPDPNIISIGCESRIAFGDWVLQDAASEVTGWYRIRNYGAFHCFALLGVADELESLEAAELRPAFFAYLGNEEVAGRTREMWVIQVGARPGSDYVLLAREAGGGQIESFEMLQARCLKRMVRDKSRMDGLRADYCAVNSIADLRPLLRQSFRLPALGKFTLARREGEAVE
jgi:hypothetical protein